MDVGIFTPGPKRQIAFAICRGFEDGGPLTWASGLRRTVDAILEVRSGWVAEEMDILETGGGNLRLVSSKFHELGVLVPFDLLEGGRTFVNPVR